MAPYNKESTASKNKQEQTLHDSDNGNIVFVSKEPSKSKIRSEDRSEQCTVALDQNSTHFGHESTQNEEILHGGGLYRRQQPRHRLLFRNIKVYATKKFVDKTQGITCLDILQLVDDPSYTLKQARNTLRNFKDERKLYTRRRTKPQEYYLSQEDADYAALKHRISTHIDPTQG
jgi:hypothetical protein